MDNTELHYLTYDPDEMWNKMITAYVEAGGDILYPGDEKEMLLRGVQSILMQAFAGMDNALRMQTVRYAVGEYLDMIGEKRGCPRLEAAKATAYVQIKANATGTESAIEAGTPMTSDGKVYWLTQEYIPLTGEAQTITTQVICDRAGEVGNSLELGVYLELTRPSLAISEIKCTAAAAGGTEAESDDAYRERLRTSSMGGLSTGTAVQYEAAAKEVSSDIVDVYAARTSAGQVTVYLVPRYEDEISALIAAVTSKLTTRDTKPLTDQVRVRQGTKLTYNIRGTYTADGSVIDAVQAIQDAFTEYQQWQDRHLGRAFNPDRLKALMYQAGATRVIFNEETSVEPDGSSGAEYQEIAKNEYLDGHVSLQIDVEG